MGPRNSYLALAFSLYTKPIPKYKTDCGLQETLVFTEWSHCPYSLPSANYLDTNDHELSLDEDVLKENIEGNSNITTKELVEKMDVSKRTLSKASIHFTL